MPTMPASYYDLFDAQKNYKKLLFRAGKGLQSRELNEMQEMMRHELRQCIDGLYGNGKLFRGGNILISGNQARLGESVMWVNGYAVDVPEATLTISTVGLCSIGVAVLSVVKAEDDDGSLRDPAVNTRNYNEPGAARLQVTGRWALDSDVLAADEEFYPIYELMDGVLQATIVPDSDLDGAMKLLARYDLAANGHYVVSGMTVTHAYDDAVGQQHVLSVKEGIAHVDGYEVTFQAAHPVRVDYGLDTREVISEPHLFDADGAYTLFNAPVAAISRVVGIKEVTRTITHGSYSGCSDTLPDQPVVSVSEVKQDATTYMNGTDFTVVGNTLNWSSAGSEPAPGSTYTVKYLYQDEMVDEVTITEDRTGINIAGLKTGTVFNVDYHYYLPRIDRIVLLKSGSLTVLRGVANEIPSAQTTSEGLSLATVRVAYGLDPVLTNDAYRAYRMSDVHSILSRINNLDATVAYLALKEDARTNNPTLVAKNLFVDPFLDDDMRDLGQAQNALVESQTLIPGVDWTFAGIRTGSDILLPYSEVTAINQNAYTKARQIDEFTWSDPPPAQITVSPNSYRWISSTRYVSSGIGTESTDDNAIIPAISLTISGSKFNAGEVVNITFDGIAAGSAIANSSGVISATFTVPAGIRAGAKYIRAVGAVSGVAGEAVFTAMAVVRTIVVRPPTPPLFPWFWWLAWNEPLAQTFTLQYDHFVSSVSLWFTVKPTTFVDVLICSTQVGMPDRKKVLARSRLYPDQITTGVAIPFPMDRLVMLGAGQEYAIVVECPDTNAKVRVAELGKWDLVNYRWLTKQAYDVGVLLQSANSSTWSPIQTEDLSFILKRASFQASNQVSLGTTAVTDATDLVLLASTEIVAGTGVSFKAVLINRNNEEVVLYPFVRTPISKYTGSVEVRATLTSNNSYISPRVAGDVQLAWGNIDLPSTYISREFALDGTVMTVLLDIYEPEGTHVDVYYWNGSAWAAVTRDVGGGTPIGDGWMQMKYAATPGVSASRIKIELISSDATGLARPAAKNLRTTIA